MLAADQRLRDGDSFRRVLRRGRRTSSSRLAVHVLTVEPGSAVTADAVSRGGLIVSRAVGNAVVRNRVKRRLRHQLSAVLARLPAGSAVVVRALPAAASATSTELRRDLDRSVSRVVPEERITMQAPS